MDAVFRYFWFLGAAVMLLNLLIWRSRLAELVRLGRIGAREASNFMRGAAVALPGTCVILGVISLWAGYPSPFCVQPFSFADGPSAAANLVTLAAWALLLWWVWAGRGADLLTRIAPILGTRPDYSRTYSPQVVRLAVTAILLVAAVGAIVAGGPTSLEQGCLTTAG